MGAGVRKTKRKKPPPFETQISTRALPELERHCPRSQACWRTSDIAPSRTTMVRLAVCLSLVPSRRAYRQKKKGLTDERTLSALISIVLHPFVPPSILPFAAAAAAVAADARRCWLVTPTCGAAVVLWRLIDTAHKRRGSVAAREHGARDEGVGDKG